MTGFGRGQATIDNWKFNVEMKTVNHRYLDTHVKMPRKFSFLEPQVKALVKKHLKRGKVDIFITYEDQNDKSNSVVINEALIGEYLEKLGSVAEKYNIKNDLSLSVLTGYPDVMKLEEQEVDEDLLWRVLSLAMEDALTSLKEMRSHEGASLKADLEQKIAYMLDLHKELANRSGLVVEDYRTRLKERLDELLQDVNGVDEQRLAQEVAVFADRCAIDEELVRLESHFKQLDTMLNSNDSVGRKLDFLAQEMNREANTVASKANDLTITNNAIALKAEIEKVREQIQNIE